jgi:hypothetical protein
MARNRLLINGKAIPLQPDTEIAITYQAHDVRTIESRDGAYAETFTLPDTEEVRNALGHSNLITSATETPYKVLNASIEQDFNTILQGKAGHTEVSEGYAIEFNGNNADLFEQIKDKNLQDLDLSDLDHAWTPLNVGAYNSHYPERGYLYPLINYGFWNERYLDGSNQHFSELFPAVYVSTILQRMALPYTITGSLLSDARFQKLVIAFTNEDFKYREGYTDQFTATGAMTGPNYFSKTRKLVTFQNYSENTAGLWDLSGSYDIIENGRYRIKVKLNVNMSSADGITNYIQINHIDLEGQFTKLDETTITKGDNQIITLDFTTEFLTAGDTLQLEWIGGGTGSQSNNVYINAGSNIEISLLNQTAPYGQVHLDANLPDMKQEDLLLTICNMFNVLIQTDPIKKVIRLDLLNDLKYKPEIDWSNKVDWKTKPAFSFQLADYAQKNIIGFEPLEYKDITGVTNQDVMTINVDNERLEPEKEIFISPFTSTELLPAFRGKQLMPYIPRVRVKVNSLGLWRSVVPYGVDDFVYWGGRYFKSKTSNINKLPGSATANDWEAVEANEVVEYKEAKPRLMLVESRGANNFINVGENALGGTFNPLNVQGIFSKPNGSGINAAALKTAYHGITEKLLTKTRFLNLKVRLSLPDISQLDFLRPIKLFIPERNLEGMFYLNKVSQFNPVNNESTEVELVRIYGMPVKTTPIIRVTTGHFEYSYEHSNEFN